MDDEMLDYDFATFKKKNDSVIDKSRLASKPANRDIFTEFEELDSFDSTNEDVDFKKSLIDGYQDLIDEAKAKKKDEILDEPLENDQLNNTMEISNFHDEILEKIDEMKEQEAKAAIEVANETNEVSDSPKKIMSLESAFIYCAILGFIIMIFGYEWIFYILNHI